MKVQITLDDDLMKRVDVFADENYMSRSGLISVAVTKYLNESEAFKAIKEMTLLMRKIADTGCVDHDTLEQLEDFERLSRFLMDK